MIALAHRAIVWRMAAVAACLLQLVYGTAGTASAHPLGNFSINQYSRLEPTGDHLRLTYVLEMAEIPTFQERDNIDTNHDGTVADGEREAYLDRKVEELRRGLSLAVDGRPVELRTRSAGITFPDGQGGLSLLRIVAEFDARVAAHALVSTAYRDDNFAGRVGWKEIVVRPGPDATLVDSDAPAEDVSNELRQYPENMLQSPLRRLSAQLEFRSGAPLPEDSLPQARGSAPVSRALDPLAALATADTGSFAVIAFALIAAAVWGSLHALSPGHGKTVVAAYLVGTRGTVVHAAVLGLSVTATHTLAVYALGLVALYASQYVLPERLYPWLSAASGLLVVALGVALLGQRVRALIRGRGAASHGSPHPHAHTDTAHGHTHGHGHVHVPPGGPDARIGWRRLLALGFSAGLLPCPSALVLMLGAISLGRIGFGLALVVAFSLGLAVVLTGFGLLLVCARRLFARIPEGNPVFRLVPTGSAVVILAAGLLIVAQSLAEVGTLAG